jgi:hypothetical protein
VWDFAAGTSNYDTLREQALSGNGGAAFLTSYSTPDELFRDAFIEIADDPTIVKPPIVKEYLSQAVKNGEAQSCDIGSVVALGDPGSAESGYAVVDVCDDQGTCGTPAAGELDSRDFACGTADDLATALIGMHPKDVGRVAHPPGGSSPDRRARQGPRPPARLEPRQGDGRGVRRLVHR